MTDIINFDIKQLIESSVSELNKNLTDNIEIKIREDVINKILETKSKESIFELDDIKEFGKVEPKDIFSDMNMKDYYSVRGYNGSPSQIQNFKLNEYPIIAVRKHISGYGHPVNYITNIENNKILTNDEIFIRLIIFNKYYNTFLLSDGQTNIIINCDKYIKKYLYNNENYNIKLSNEYDKIIKQYFDTIADYKIKSIEYDKIKNKQFNEMKLIEENKELEEEIYNIQTENIRLKEQNNKLDEENNIQKIIIKDFESRVQNNKNELQEYKHKYEQLIKDLEIQKQTFENDLLKKELQLVLLSNK